MSAERHQKLRRKGTYEVWNGERPGTDSAGGLMLDAIETAGLKVETLIYSERWHSWTAHGVRRAAIATTDAASG